MSCFFAIKLDITARTCDPMAMARRPPTESAARLVQDRIERGGERLWRAHDFTGLPPTAVSQALSRLARAGQVKRLSKGVYYRGRPTALGPSRPNPGALRDLAGRSKPLFPSGAAAAGELGFTTQAHARAELATSASSLPRKLVGKEAVVHTRRPAAWAGLSQRDAALLDFLRQAGRSSELAPDETVRRTLHLLADGGRYRRLVEVAPTEPPRVRALLGALGTELEQPASALTGLRESLNPLSRFDFGVFVHLPAASDWQAKRPA